MTGKTEKPVKPSISEPFDFRAELPGTRAAMADIRPDLDDRFALPTVPENPQTPEPTGAELDTADSIRSIQAPTPSPTVASANGVALAPMATPISSTAPYAATAAAASAAAASAVASATAPASAVGELPASPLSPVVATRDFAYWHERAQVDPVGQTPPPVDDFATELQAALANIERANQPTPAPAVTLPSAVLATPTNKTGSKPSIVPTPTRPVPATVQLPPAPHLTLRLATDRLETGPEDADQQTPLDKLAAAVLGGPGQRYRLLDSRHNMLLDTQNRLLHAQTTPAAAVFYKSSVPLQVPGPSTTGDTLFVNRGRVLVPWGNGVPPNLYDSGLTVPGPALTAQVSGIHTSAKTMWRLEGEHLHFLDNDGWQRVASDVGYRSLHSLGNGEVCGIDTRGRVRLVQNPEPPLPLLHESIAIARLPQGGYISLAHNGDHYFLEQLDAEGQRSLRFMDLQGHEPTSLGCTGDTLYVGTRCGRIFQANRQDPALSLGESEADSGLINSFGKPRFTGFFTDDGGTLQARVMDAKGREHACPLQEERFVPGWHLSNVLVLDRHQNLRKPVAPTEHEKVHLPLGSVALHNGSLLTLDGPTQEWRPSGETGIRHLQMGQDGFAYLADAEGSVKRLAVSRLAPNHDFSDGPNLSMPGRSTVASIGPLTGAAKVDVEKIAALNEQHYVTLSSGQLRVHDNRRARARLLAPGPDQAPISAICIGGRDLYALQANRIYKMPAKDWLAEHMGHDNERRWQTMDLSGLPGPVVDLRPGKDGQVTARTAQGEFIFETARWQAQPPSAPPSQPSEAGSDMSRSSRLRERLRGKPEPTATASKKIPVEPIDIGGEHVYALVGNLICTMPNDWAGGNEQWKPLKHVGLEGEVIGLRAEDGDLIATTNECEFKLQAPAWIAAAPLTERAPADRHHYNDLLKREKLLGVRTVGKRFKTDITFFGRGNAQALHKSEFTPASRMEFLTAYLFPSSLKKAPAMLKVAGDYLQHTYRGRDGLALEYQAEYQALQVLQDEVKKARPQAKCALEVRIQELRSQVEHDPAGSELVELLDWFQRETSKTIHANLRTVGEQAASRWHPNSSRPLEFNGGLNPKYKRHKVGNNNLVLELDNVLRAAGITADGPAGELLSAFTANRVLIEHADPQKPSARRRDIDDRLVLPKARLALDAKFLLDISTVVDHLEHVVQTCKTEDERRPHFDGLNKVTAFLCNRWEHDLVKKRTEVGFNGNRQMEIVYDIIKNTSKQASKKHHAVALNLREGLQSTQEDLALNLKTAVRSLRPAERLGFARNYSGGVSGAIYFPVGPLWIGPRLSADPERVYAVDFTREDEHLWLTLGREGSDTYGASFIYGGVPFSSTSAMVANNTPGSAVIGGPSPAPGDNDDHLYIGGRFGGSIDGKYTSTETHALRIRIKESDLDEVIDLILGISGKEPMDLLELGTKQEIRSGVKSVFDLQAAAAAELRISEGRTQATPIATYMRFAAGVVASQNLVRYAHQRVEGRGAEDQKTQVDSQNRLRVGENSSFVGYARLFDTIFAGSAGEASIIGGLPLGISASFTVDRSTNKAFEVGFQEATAPTKEVIAILQKNLRDAFPDITQIDRISHGSMSERLKNTGELYTDAPVDNEDQYAALRSLRTLQNEELAANHGRTMINKNEMTITRNDIRRINVDSRLKQAWDLGKSVFNGAANPSNAQHIQALMVKEPALAEILEQLQQSEGNTRADIVLELKEDARYQIEHLSARGELSDKSLHERLTDTQNLRVASMAIFRSVGKKDSFVLPMPSINYRSSSALVIDGLLAKVHFEYGMDQLNPKRFRVDGQTAADTDNPSNQTTANALASSEFGEYRPLTKNVAELAPEALHAVQTATNV